MEYITIIQYALFSFLGSFFIVMSSDRTGLVPIIMEIGLNMTMGLGLAMMIHGFNPNKMFNAGLSLVMSAFGYRTSKKMVEQFVKNKILREDKKDNKSNKKITGK